MTLTAVVLAVATVLVWRPPWGWVRVRVTGLPAVRPGRRAIAPTVAIVLVASLVLLPPAPTIIVWSLAAVVVTAASRLRRATLRRRRELVRDEAQAVLDALVTELRSGAPPVTAVVRLATESTLLEPVAVVASGGGDVATALAGAGARPGAGCLVQVGRAWEVSEACGAPLVTVLERVRESSREDAELDREVSAGVAPARATGSLMAAMPPLGLGLGSGLGVDPLDVVTGTVPGAVCVALGVGFAIAGVRWIDRIADEVEVPR